MRYSIEEKITNWFTWHPPIGDEADCYAEIRQEARRMASRLLDLCPESRERTTALNKLREAVMWANASIACNREAELEVEVNVKTTPQEAIDALLEAGEEYGQVSPGESPKDTPGR
jgi:hypothetical protein